MLIAAKRTVSLISAMIFMLAALTAFAAVSDTYSGTCGDNLTWTLDGDGVLTISGTGEMDSYYPCTAPWYSSCESITAVVIEDGVTGIGGAAFFWCVSLTSVTIPDSVTHIGWLAFQSCTSLASVTIPDSVTSIGENAFGNCVSLTNVTIPAGVTLIIWDAFRGCDSLTRIDVAEENENYTSIDGMLFDKAVTELIQYPIGKTESSYTIPDGVTRVGFNAFEGCNSLTSVTIPDSVTEIGSAAFQSCMSLTDVYYTGTEDEWSAISIESENEYLTEAMIHYNYVPPIPEITAAAATASEDVITVTATIENAGSGKVFAVGITAEGEATSVTPITGGKAEIKGEKIRTVKVFLWESLESMKPLCEAKEAAVE